MPTAITCANAIQIAATFNVNSSCKTRYQRFFGNDRLRPTSWSMLRFAPGAVKALRSASPADAADGLDCACREPLHGNYDVA